MSKIVRIYAKNFMAHKDSEVTFDGNSIINFCELNASGKTAFTMVLEILGYNAYKRDQVKFIEEVLDLDFMEAIIAELESERVVELEAELTAYTKVSGFEDYELTIEEIKTLQTFEQTKWKEFNLKDLFGEATRGKRLKRADRISGTLPFVTAGEADEGISDFIGNNVYKFARNTITIDMFGSAKYRDYEYGCDDHIAVVHTENLPKNVAIFVTTAIHKSSHNGQFDYGKNFYAKDADALWISLPVKNGKPDFNIMELKISAIQKLIIKDVVQYTEKKVTAAKTVIGD